MNHPKVGLRIERPDVKLDYEYSTSSWPWDSFSTPQRLDI